MSRSLRKISRNQAAYKALAELGKAIPQLQGGIKGLVEALPKIEGGESKTEVEKLVEALVDDVQVLARENEIIRETFLRLLIALSEDSEENIRKVEATIRAEVIQEFEGT